MTRPPLLIDPFRFIIDVRWPGDIVAVTLEWTATNVGTATPIPSFVLDGLPWPNATTNAFAIIYDHDGQGDGAVVDPISGNMMGHVFLWSKPTIHNVDEQESQPVTITVVDRELCNIIADNGAVLENYTDPIFGILVPFYVDHTGDMTGGGAYDVLAPDEVQARLNMIDGLTPDDTLPPPLRANQIEIIRSHEETTTRTFYTREQRTNLFFNIGKIRSLIDGDDFSFLIRMPPITPASHGSEWKVEAASYKGEKSFPVDAEHKPAWSHEKEKARAEDDETGDEVIGIPDPINIRVTVTFDDLALTMARV